MEIYFLFPLSFFLNSCFEILTHCFPLFLEYKFFNFGLFVYIENTERLRKKILEFKTLRDILLYLLKKK